jgi:hypothetical protein
MISSIVIIWDQMTFKYYNTTKEVLSLFMTAFLEPLLYHPLIVFFSLKGYFSYITSQELAWGTMTRKGFDIEDDQKKKSKIQSKNKNDSDPNSNNNFGKKKPSLFDRLKNKKSSKSDFGQTKT